MDGWQWREGVMRKRSNKSKEGVWKLEAEHMLALRVFVE
jgi:hypothetical protein